jgi:DNA-binding LacI/PurR family transcriptional regulator
MSRQPIGKQGPAGLSYKFQRVRERLRQAIEGSELTGKLPGERELSKRYGANPKTINKALTDLATEGLLVRHVGRGTFVGRGVGAKSGSAPAERLTFGYVVPADGLSACAQELYRRTAAVLRGLGHELQQLTIPQESSGELSGRRLSADRLRAFDGLALFGFRPSSALLASAAREHIPLVMAGNQHEQMRTAAVLVDYAQGAFELCQHLIYLGHKEIRLCIDPALAPAADAAERGYRAAMQRNSLTARPLCDGDAAMLAGETGRPTAVICVGAAQVGMVLKSVQNRSSLSLCCIPEPCDTAPAQQRVTSYEADADQLARWVADLLISASPARWQRVVVVPGRIVERGSTAPAAGPVQTPRKPETAEF